MLNALIKVSSVNEMLLKGVDKDVHLTPIFRVHILWDTLHFISCSWTERVGWAQMGRLTPTGAMDKLPSPSATVAGTTNVVVTMEKIIWKSGRRLPTLLHIEAETGWPPFSRRHLQMHFSEIMHESRLRFQWSLFLRCTNFPMIQLTIFHHWFTYLNQCWLVHRPMCASLSLSGLINSWWHKTGSKLVRVMVRCPEATTHYLKQKKQKKTLPETMLTYHQWGLMIIICGQLGKRCISHRLIKLENDFTHSYIISICISIYIYE